MSKKFGEIGQQEHIVAGSDVFDPYVQSIDVLPDASTKNVDDCYLLTEPMAQYKKGTIYIVRLINNVKVWKDITIPEWGKLVAPTVAAGVIPRFWKRLAPDGIILHWDSPVDVVNTDPFLCATWKYDVIVRKRGSTPTSTKDGEIVGRSTVRNQFNTESKGFLDYLNRYDSDETNYFYAVFAVTIGDQETLLGSTQASLSWEEVQQEIRQGTYKRAFRVGDIFTMPVHDKYGSIDAQIVAFDHSYFGDTTNKPASITFMTVPVLGNKSFDNKELAYALTNDGLFKANKTYYTRSGTDYDSWVFTPYDLSEHGYNVGAAIPTSIKGSLYEDNPSVRYFVNTTLSAVDTATKQTQSTINCGSSRWTLSNLRLWMTRTLLERDEETGERSGTYSVAEQSGGVYTATADHWAKQNNPSGNNIWYATPNGWFTAGVGDRHNVAPASAYAASFIDELPFQDGFADYTFLKMLMPVMNTTITDQYVNRYTRSSTDDTVIASTNPATIIADQKFWIPSFSEIYGRRPYSGINGSISSAETSGYSEGDQFDYFKDNQHQDELVKYSYDDTECSEPMAWYLRTCDPTTVGRVYYMDTKRPDDSSDIEKTCTAHRFTVGDDIKCGPAICFTVYAPEED